MPHATLRLLWRHPLSSSPRGLRLAREANLLLTWNQSHWVQLLNHRGELQGQVQLPEGIVDACIADDGSGMAVVGAKRTVALFQTDGKERWRMNLPATPLAAAIESLGQFLAVSDVESGVHIFDGTGQRRSQFLCPKAVKQLSFAPASARLTAAADFGLVGALDFTGRWLWRDGLVVNVGGLAVTEDADPSYFASYSEGLHIYTAKGQHRARWPTPEPCVRVSASVPGDLIAAAGLGSKFWLFDRGGALLLSQSVEGAIVDIALGALGRDVVVATNHAIERYEIA